MTNIKAVAPAFESPFFKDFYPKSDTGYVGLTNEGSTCYLNSFLQTLVALPHFRQVIFSQENNSDGKSKAVPTTNNASNRQIQTQLALLFARLKLSEMGAISTMPLCKSFGWDRASMFRQHDVQELYHVLNRSLRCQNKDLGPHLDNIFFGKMYVEAFSDLSLVVKGFGHLEESLKAFTAEERLEGENAVMCSICGGKQPYIRKTAFKELPEVLVIQLKRFGWDFSNGRGKRVKNEDRMEIPYELLVAASSDKNDDDDDANDAKMKKYRAVSVLMHSGLAATGHYYAFVQPKEEC
eukprot:jgi/Bigna1/80602/fgenesh1_pg.72_\